MPEKNADSLFLHTRFRSVLLGDTSFGTESEKKTKQEPWSAVGIS